jgi:hypothetical protein
VNEDESVAFFLSERGSHLESNNTLKKRMVHTQEINAKWARRTKLSVPSTSAEWTMLVKWFDAVSRGEKQMGTEQVQGFRLKSFTNPH